MFLFNFVEVVFLRLIESQIVLSLICFMSPLERFTEMAAPIMFTCP